DSFISLPNTLPVTNPSLLNFFAFVCMFLFSAFKVFIYLFLQNLMMLSSLRLCKTKRSVKYVFCYMYIITPIINNTRVFSFFMDYICRMAYTRHPAAPVCLL